MNKAVVGHIYSYSFKGLALTFVDGHCQARETGNCTRLNSKGNVELLRISGTR